ncbi:MAG: HAMP domain-containing protein [Betaproteobacteria bacterium]|jgi:two-component system, OmpR family, sensor kinase|nr:HAMP domain-containing protein [Betaproteobacteria bacterium]
MKLTRRLIEMPLYLRLWFAVVLAVVALSAVFAWMWRVNVEPAAIRHVVVRNEAGQVIGQATAPPVRIPGQGVEFELMMADGERMFVHLPPPQRRADGPPPPRPWFGGRTSLMWMMVIVALAVALGSYPIVRRLTQRLEALQRGVEQWGEGDLSARVSQTGNDEVGKLARRFNQAAQRVQTLVQTHKSLLANASHELRTPLARIRMGLELMERATPAQQPALRAELDRNVSELDQLVDEILLASRLDARETDIGAFESVDLLALAAEEGSRTDAQLAIEPPDASAGAFVLEGVPRLLRRLMRNLLENARRHGDGHAQLLLAREGPSLVLRVSDHGPGVPESERERIFEPFYRLPGTTEREGGAGLGLALVRAIATRHGGSVHCEAAEGGGACFVVRLPVEPAQAEGPRA